MLDVKILLLEGADRVLPPYPPVLSERAAKSLDKLGGTVITGTKFTDIEDHIITYTDGEQTHQIQAATAIWAAGMKASALAHVLAERTGVALDVFGRVKVTEHLTVPGQTDTSQLTNSPFLFIYLLMILLFVSCIVFHFSPSPIKASCY